MAGSVIPSTAQEVFDEVARTRSIPWIPDDPEARALSWRQLVQENWVAPEFAGLIHELQRILANSGDPKGAFATMWLRMYAKNHNLRYTECTP